MDFVWINKEKVNMQVLKILIKIVSVIIAIIFNTKEDNIEIRK